MHDPPNLGVGGVVFFFEYFFTVLSYQPKIFWGQTGRLKTTFEEKMKCIGGLKKFLGPYEKKVWTKKSQKKARSRDFLSSKFLLKSVD